MLSDVMSLRVQLLNEYLPYWQRKFFINNNDTWCAAILLAKSIPSKIEIASARWVVSRLAKQLRVIYLKVD